MATKQNTNVQPDLVRLNVNLNKETAAALKKIASSNNLNLTETIRRAIALLAFIDDEKKQGRKIQTMDKDESHKRELMMM